MDAEMQEDYERLQIYPKKSRVFSCFLCPSSGTNMADYFSFEHDQKLLHSQKTVTALLSQLLGKKVLNVDNTTVLCSNCTALVNEADSVVQRHDQIRHQVRGLHEQKHFKQVDVESACEITIGEMMAPVAEESVVSYSKRGRKRKATVFNDALQKFMKVEPLEDDEASIVVESKENARKKGKGRGRPRAVRGRPGRSTLVGRGLEGQYPTTNKRSGLATRGTKAYNCAECGEEFQKYADLVMHRKEVHTLVDNTPLEVEETVLESGIITYFNKDKANSMDTSHPCKDCGKIFLRKDDLSYHHEISHTDGRGKTKSAFKDKSYSCEECGETFLFKYKLKIHINNKHLNDAGTSAKDFICGVCGSKLGSLPGLTFHMRKHHNKVLNYKKSNEYLCNDCGIIATSQKKLKEHQQAQCGNASKEQVQCEICGKTVLKVSLKMHRIKMHSDFKEQCDQCGERYATKTDLLRHINVVHLNILLYTCKICNEKFPTSDALRYHRVKVHEKPSFFCQLCPKSYKRVGELNTHIKRAHNDRRKDEVCSYCGKKYYDRSGLRNHLISKHNVPQELTYTENYLRKKRVDGLPLSKHMERKLLNKQEIELIHPMGQEQQQQQQQLQTEGTHHHHSTTHQQMPHEVMHEAHHHQPQHHILDEAAVAARSLARYNDNHNVTEEASLVVAEITENAEHHQILIDPLNNILPQGIPIQHPHQVPQQHHHQPVQPRLGIVYQMNQHVNVSSHINM